MKTVLITGGSRGIGAELVRRFSKEGYGVAFVYHRSEEAAAEVAEKTGAFPIRCDVSSEDEAVAAVKKARELLGHIDLLINNAAISGGRLFTDITGEEWNRFFAVNLHGAFYFSREVLREMIARKSGKIISRCKNISAALRIGRKINSIVCFCPNQSSGRIGSNNCTAFQF